MRITKVYREQIADDFAEALDSIARLDPIPYYRKREAAKVAARAAWEYLQEHSQ